MEGNTDELHSRIEELEEQLEISQNGESTLHKLIYTAAVEIKELKEQLQQAKDISVEWKKIAELLMIELRDTVDDDGGQSYRDVIYVYENAIKRDKI